MGILLCPGAIKKCFSLVIFEISKTRAFKCDSNMCIFRKSSTEAHSASLSVSFVFLLIFFLPK